MEASNDSVLQSSPKPGEIVIQPNGTKLRAGIDGELFHFCDGDDPINLLPDTEDLGIALKDDLIHIGKGEAVDIQIIDAEARPPSVVKHRWLGGLSIVCPEHTSPELLDETERDRKCPLCTHDSLPRTLDYFLAVILRARKNTSGQWRSEPRQRAKILRMTPGMGKRFRELGDEASMMLIVGRNNDEYGTYFVENSKTPSVEIKCSTSTSLRRQRVESEAELQSLLATAKAINGLELRSGRVEKWRELFPGVPLIAIWPGRKKPIFSGYLNPAKWREWMRDDNYLRQMDQGQGIALLLVAGYVVIDLDRDEDIVEFERRNPWARDCMSNRGGRGVKYFVKMKGEYSQRVLHVFAQGEHVGEFRGATLAVLDNIHPSGKFYEVRNEGAIAEITYGQILWPEGWKLESPKSREFERGFDDHVEGGLLELGLLKHVHPHPTKTGALQAQCPACAEGGSDKSGNHLILFDGGSGRFGCVVDQSPEHYSRIFELAKRESFRQRDRIKETIEGLAALDAIEYDQQRASVAHKLDIRTATLDQMVAAKRQEKKTGAEAKLFTDHDPWPEPVDGAQLADELRGTAHRFLVLPPGAYLVFALWAMHTHRYWVFDYTPILNFKSPLKRCGKSLCLDLLKHFCCKAIKFDTPTAAVLFRLIEEYHPTALIDEWDSIAGEDMQLAVRGVLNSGFHKDGCVPRCVGDNHEPRLFSTFAPKAISGIGELPDTAQDRAISIQMRRKLPSEERERFRKFDGTELYRKCARWAADNHEKLAVATPAMPAWMNDRQMDIWEPLLAVADLCGEGEAARDAAFFLCPHDEDEDNSVTVELLRDIREIFQRDVDGERDEVSTEDLLWLLNKDETRPWATLIKGKPLHARRLADMLRPFGISPKQIKNAGRAGKGGKGYVAEHFEEAFRRYL